MKPLYNITNYRTPISPKMYDCRNLSNLPSDYDREYCWKCGLKTKKVDCPRCGEDKFFMTDK